MGHLCLRENYDTFFPHLSSRQSSGYVDVKASPPTHLGGLPTQLSVTLIKSSVPLNGACSAANLAFVEVSGGSDSRHIMQNKETNKTLFALKNALQRYRLDFMAWHKMSFTAIPNGTGLGHFQGLTPRLDSCSWREIPFNYAKNKNKNNAKYIL